MGADYSRQILRVLYDAGEGGVGAKALAKHVYNKNCTLFSVPDFEEIYREVRNFLRRNSGKPHSVVEPAKGRGKYRLNLSRSEKARIYAREMKREAAGEKGDAQPAAPAADISLDLFG